jgi:hypothetical protein
MIEIFTTTVTNQKDADAILHKIHSAFPGYDANFDLTDCDHILRVSSGGTLICAPTLIAMIKHFGFVAAVLPDVLPDQRYRDTLQTSVPI